MSSTALSVGQYIEFQAAVLRQLPRPDQIESTVMRGWINNQHSLKEALADCLLIPSVPVVKGESKILELVWVVAIRATTEKFIAKNKFICDNGNKAKVKISCLCNNFLTWFLLGAGKIEDPIQPQVLRYAKFSKTSVDLSVIEELGGEAKAETTLTELFSLLEKQAKGEDGVLSNNGWANLFYIKDQNDMLRTIDVSWDGVGWCLRARSVGSSDRRNLGLQVFYRNPDLEPSETLVC